ncbi:MAG: MerR family transcriptional regulator [Acidimicrobiales bacterium]
MTGAPGRLRIGEVHALLRQDFPDIELSKIRYYEDKGLVAPSRSRKGYRLYSERDVACLREAVRLAQEEFVPLRVVRLRLIEQGLLESVPVAGVERAAARHAALSTVSAPAPSRATVASPGADGPVALRSATPEDTTSTDPVTAPELCEMAGLSDGELASLVALGLVHPRTQGRETVFSAVDARVAAAAGVLVRRGVDVRLLGALRRVVERELGVVDDLTEPLRGPASTVAPAAAGRVVAQVAAEVAGLRAVLYERELGEYLND